jgi:DNA-binding MarR family transcriptional regulator
MKYYSIVLFMIILTSCQVEDQRTLENILQSSFEVKQISGYDSPKIDIRKDSLYAVLTALHYGISPGEITNQLGWDKATMKKKLDALIENQLLAKEGDKYCPRLAVLTLQRGNDLKERSGSIAKEIADSIVNKLSEIKRLHSETEISTEYDFQELSFFYLSNVLLDNGQIRHVEEEFLKKERPLRNGSRYYLAIQEKDQSTTTEAYGIYGNTGLLRNDSVYIAVYGNTRVASNQGWKNYLDKPVYVFNKADLRTIDQEMPGAFLPDLLSILEKNRSYFESVYKKLDFDNEISFEEFFIWWYHFIYSETTDLLIEKRIIKKPEGGLFYYEMRM